MQQTFLDSHPILWIIGRKWWKKKKTRLIQGGKRYQKFDKYDQEIIESYIWILCQEDKTRLLSSYRYELIKIGYDVSKESLRKIFSRWNWTWKKPFHIQINKFSPRNVARYQTYCDWVLNLTAEELVKVKFMDECHFVSKDVWKRYALGQKKERCVVVQKGDFSESFSLSCICSIDSTVPATYYTTRKSSNSQFDWLAFIVEVVTKGYLKEGDILVCDNATVHGDLYTFQLTHLN